MLKCAKQVRAVTEEDLPVDFALFSSTYCAVLIVPFIKILSGYGKRKMFWFLMWLLINLLHWFLRRIASKFLQAQNSTIHLLTLHQIYFNSYWSLWEGYNWQVFTRSLLAGRIIGIFVFHWERLIPFCLIPFGGRHHTLCMPALIECWANQTRHHSHGLCMPLDSRPFFTRE